MDQYRARSVGVASRGRLHWLEEHKDRADHAREPVTASTTQPRCDNAGAFLHNAVDPNLPQGGGFRPIDAARQNGDARVEQLLLEHGASAPRES